MDIYSQSVRLVGDQRLFYCRRDGSKMKRYFEYRFNDQVKDRLLKYYNSQDGISDFGNGARKTALKLTRIEKYIPYHEGDYICDVGCADGALLAYLQGHYEEGLGIDISDRAIAKCRLLGLQNVRFDTFDGETIHSDKPFDKVFIMDVLEHTFSPQKLIKSIYRNLKQGGVLVIQVPFTGWLSELIFGKYHYGHLRYYDEKFLKDYLEAEGFIVKHLKVFNSVPASAFFLRMPRLFSGLKKICDIIPHKIYPYYGSVVAIAEKV